MAIRIDLYIFSGHLAKIWDKRRSARNDFLITSENGTLHMYVKLDKELNYSIKSATVDLWTIYVQS
jgi:hypothetical protein